MTTDLSTMTEAFISNAIARGAYRNRSEVLEAGVELLRKHEQLLAKIDEGRRQLDEGEYVEFDQAGLKQFFEGLKDRARAAARAKLNG
jgi:putative addiction module CopG family antidote